MSNLSLIPLGQADLAKVAHITVAPEHQVFAGTFAEAFETAEKRVDFHAILEAGKAVGLFKVDRVYPDRYPFAQDGTLGLRAFIVDHARQSLGIASRAVRALPAYLRPLYPDAGLIYLTVNKVNPAAVRAYLKGGFEDTGAEWPHGDAGPQYVVRLGLGPHP